MTLNKALVNLAATFAAILTGLAVAACGSSAPPTPTPDIPATVEAAVQQALPTPTPTSTPDIRATVQAEVEATMAAIPTETATPTPTATPLPTATPTPTATVTPTLTPTPTATPLPTWTPTSTTRPSPTPSPTPNLATMVEQVKTGVVRISTNSGSGTGVIFETSGDGRAFVLTNYHVVDDAYRIEVQITDGSRYSATLQGYDAYKDLAVLEICCSRFRSLRFKDATTLKAGSEVVAIGYPLGFFGSATVTRGIVSAVRYDSRHQAWVIQTDAPINPGNSGGPLLSSTGDVVGINTFSVDWSATGRPIDGVGFAISEQTIRGVLQSMKLGSRISFPTPTATPWPTPTSTPWPTPTRVSVLWHTYNNSTYGYSIRIPIHWNVDDRDKSFVKFTSPDRFLGITISAFNWRARSVSEWINRVESDNSDFFKERFEVNGRNTTEDSDGTGTAYISYRARVSRQYCDLLGGDTLVVGYSGSYHKHDWICQHSFDDNFDTLTTIGNSFSIDW